MTDAVTRALAAQVSKKEYDAIQSGTLSMLLVPADPGWTVGVEIRVIEVYADWEPTGRVLFAKVTYVTSADNQCVLSPEALNPGFAVLSIALGR
jgi:hypothetical protein